MSCAAHPLARLLFYSRIGRREMAARKVVYIGDPQEGDPGQIGSLLGALSEAGALMELFTDGWAGLESIARGTVDLVVVDMDAPSLAGFDARIRIGQIASRMPVLLLSEVDSKARRMWAVEAGVVGFATKPVDRRALARFIAKVLNAI